VAELSLSVELLRVTAEPATPTPPPIDAELPLMVEFVTEQVPFKHESPPPEPAGAELPFTVEFFKISDAVGEPELEIPPPPPVPFDTLLAITTPSKVSIPPEFSTPPPSVALRPFEMVNPVTETVNAPFTLKIFEALFPEMVNAFAPGPVMVRFLPISIDPLVNVTGLARPAVKVMVPPSQASSTACRKLPLPPLLLFVTTGAAVHTV
jgi:hypothetical protein